MPKFKFSNKSDAGGEGIEVLPCKHRKPYEHALSGAGAGVTFEFDKTDTWVLRLSLDNQWLTIGDIDELQALLKAAKKRAVKLGIRNAA